MGELFIELYGWTPQRFQFLLSQDYQQTFNPGNVSPPPQSFFIRRSRFLNDTVRQLGEFMGLSRSRFLPVSLEQSSITTYLGGRDPRSALVLDIQYPLGTTPSSRRHCPPPTHLQHYLSSTCHPTCAPNVCCSLRPVAPAHTPPSTGAPGTTFQPDLAETQPSWQLPVSDTSNSYRARWNLRTNRCPADQAANVPVFGDELCDALLFNVIYYPPPGPPPYPPPPAPPA